MAEPRAPARPREPNPNGPKPNGPPLDGPGLGGSSAAARELAAFVDRYERLQDEIDARNADKRDLLAELKSRGFDKATFKRVIALRRQDAAARAAEAATLDLYLTALGMA